jgi:hypothetical protein
MAYNETYATADTSKVVIDLIVGIGSAIFSFASLIALIMLYRWLRGKRVGI